MRFTIHDFGFREGQAAGMTRRVVRTGRRSARSLPSEARTARRAIPTSAFTLVELLTVITIIAIIAAVTAPVLNAFKPNVSASAERQLLDALARARQLAISQRTTVYMVFCPTNFWSTTYDPSGAFNTVLGLSTPPGVQSEAAKGMKLLNKQLVGYNFVSLKTLGDQPGRPTPRYLSSWQTLPEGAFIPIQKFLPKNLSQAPVMVITNTGSGMAYSIYGFAYTNTIPFPSDQIVSYAQFSPNNPSPASYVPLPYVAFNYLGQLVDGTGNPTGMDELIPLTKGAVMFAKNPDKSPATNFPQVVETPAGNATNSFDLVRVDWLTGRAHAERLEVK